MKTLITSILTLLFLTTSPLVYAELKTYDIDLDNDGKDELIEAYQQFDFPENTLPIAIEGIVAVYKRPDVKKIGQFSMPDRLGKIEFVSLNKDNVKQIVAWSSGGAHYTNIAIYGYRDGKLYKIFENGSACYIDTDFETKKPIIKVGRENWEQKDWCYATGKPLWQVYVWTGKEFVYDKKLSTSPEISQEEATQRFIDKIKGMLNE